MIHRAEIKRPVYIIIGIPNLYNTRVVLMCRYSFTCTWMRIRETNFRRYARKIFIKYLCNFPTINNGIIVFTQNNVVAISEFFIWEKWRNSAPEWFVLLTAIVIKISCHRLLSKGNHFISLTPIFVPEFGSKLTKFVTMTLPMRVLVYQAISSASSKISMTWKGADCKSYRKSTSLKCL